MRLKNLTLKLFILALLQSPGVLLAQEWRMGWELAVEITRDDDVGIGTDVLQATPQRLGEILRSQGWGYQNVLDLQIESHDWDSQLFFEDPPTAPEALYSSPSNGHWYIGKLDVDHVLEVTTPPFRVAETERLVEPLLKAMGQLGTFTRGGGHANIDDRLFLAHPLKALNFFTFFHNHPWALQLFAGAGARMKDERDIFERGGQKLLFMEIQRLSEMRALTYDDVVRAMGQFYGAKGHGLFIKIGRVEYRPVETLKSGSEVARVGRFLEAIWNFVPGDRILPLKVWSGADHSEATGMRLTAKTGEGLLDSLWLDESDRLHMKVPATRFLSEAAKASLKEMFDTLGLALRDYSDFIQSFAVQRGLALKWAVENIQKREHHPGFKKRIPLQLFSKLNGDAHEAKELLLDKGAPLVADNEELADFVHFYGLETDALVRETLSKRPDVLKLLDKYPPRASGRLAIPHSPRPKSILKSDDLGPLPNSYTVYLKRLLGPRYCEKVLSRSEGTPR